MSLFKTRSAAVVGIDAQPVDVEVDLYRSGMARDFIRRKVEPSVRERESSHTMRTRPVRRMGTVKQGGLRS